MSLNANSSVIDSNQTPDNLSGDQWETLRHLLLSSERATIEALQSDLTALRERIESPEQRTHDIGEVLSQATALSQASNDDLSNALRPVLEAQFSVSARENPELMAEALFPILGPAIRKMIASLFKFDAKFSGKPYSIEQLFLIDRNTGLPIVHVVREETIAQDADMVSGMLSAIQSYVQEAFSTPSFDGLNTLELGDLSVWIEWGPNAVLASVIRGIGPESFRYALQQRLELVHQQYAAQLRNYDGDSDTFESLQIELHDFIHNHDAKAVRKVPELTHKQRLWAYTSGVVLCALLAWFVYAKVDAHQWQGYINQLKDSPGIVVVDESRGFGRYRVEGLRDPMAKDPRSLLELSPFEPETVDIQFTPYQSLDSGFVLKRARALLDLPDTVQLELEGTMLIVIGRVSSQLLKDVRRLGPMIAGVDSIRYQSYLPSQEN